MMECHLAQNEPTVIIAANNSVECQQKVWSESSQVEQHSGTAATTTFADASHLSQHQFGVYAVRCKGDQLTDDQ